MTHAVKAKVTAVYVALQCFWCFVFFGVTKSSWRTYWIYHKLYDWSISHLSVTDVFTYAPCLRTTFPNKPCVNTDQDIILQKVWNTWCTILLKLYPTVKSKTSIVSIPNPPVSQLIAFVWAHVAEVCEQVVERMSSQVQSSASLMRVKKSDDIQAKVPLEPLDIRVGTMKYLRRGQKDIQLKNLSGELLKVIIIIIYYLHNLTCFDAEINWIKMIKNWRHNMWHFPIWIISQILVVQAHTAHFSQVSYSEWLSHSSSHTQEDTRQLY